MSDLEIMQVIWIFTFGVIVGMILEYRFPSTRRPKKEEG